MTKGAAMATRSRGKKGKDAEVNSVEEVLRRIGDTGTWSQQEVLTLYYAHKPVCQSCKQNQKESANCFCALAPATSGFRRQGLWQKVPQGVLDLGADPATERREDASQPVGLMNLGATCYVNSVLQVLYMDLQFRAGLFAVEQNLLEKQPVLFQLAQVFTELQVGRKRIVDPRKFAETLQIDSGIQQDGQEFLKLLLTLLENLLEQSSNSAVKRLVQERFRGSFAYVTRCSVCGKNSASSSKEWPFYELEVNVKGFDSLVDSLDNYLQEEVLEGDNKFHCEHCNKRVDATRHVELRTLPPVLSFQLKRFVFVPQTMSKKKVTSRFSFPRAIDLSTHINKSDGRSTAQWYDLAAILVHKGSLATSGHYIAKVKDERTGMWWQFDDETAVNLGEHPLGDAPPASVTEVSPKTGDQPSASANGASPQPADAEILTSADAYMLMYRRRALSAASHEPAVEVSARRRRSTKRSIESGQGVQQASPKRPKTEPVTVSVIAVEEPSASNAHEETGRRQSKRKLADTEADSSKKSKVETAEQVASIEEPKPPDFLMDQVEQENQTLTARCQEYKEKKEVEEQKVQERRDHVREVLKEAPVEPGQKSYYWISSDWLKAWADAAEDSGEIDNSALLCQHGKVAPSKAAHLKRVSPQAWTMLHSKYGGGPELTDKDFCKQCILESAQAAQSADKFRSTRATMQHLMETSSLGIGCSHYVSKSWLANWLRRSKANVAVEADSNPTESLLCPHGGLKPDDALGAKRQAVPQAVWEYFHSIAAEVCPGEAGERLRKACPVSMEDCVICKEHWSSQYAKQEELRSEKSRERAEHEVIYAGKAVPVTEGRAYNLVSTVWLQAWRQFLGAGSKANKQPTEVPPLDESMRALWCDKHQGLLQHPPELTYRRNELVQKNLSDDPLTLISHEDWQTLAARWHCPDSLQVSAFPVDTAASDQANLQEEKDAESAGAEGLDGPDVVCLGEKPAEKRKPLVLLTEPQVCHDCINEQVSAQMARQMSYEQGTITVELLRGKEPPAHLKAGGSEGERRSRRARKASAIGGGLANLVVSAGSTVKQLKMQVWECLGVSEDNQRLGIAQKELTDDSELLVNCNIYPGSQLWLINTAQHANRDIAEALGAGVEESFEVEEGFKGTGLLAGAMKHRRASGEGASARKEESSPNPEDPEVQLTESPSLRIEERCTSQQQLESSVSANSAQEAGQVDGGPEDLRKEHVNGTTVKETGEEVDAPILAHAEQDVSSEVPRNQCKTCTLINKAGAGRCDACQELLL